MCKNPINVDIAKDMIKLRKLIKNERKNEWLNIRKDRIENKNKNMYHGGNIFENAIIEHNIFARNRNNDMKKELAYLSQKECEIITKLRTERINLNHYLFSMGIKKGKHDYKCKRCNVPETVDHFLMKCRGVTDKMHVKLNKNNVNYDIERLKLRKELRKISIFFKNGLNFSTQNILFPHIWQRRISGRKRSDNWNRDGTYFRAQILKAVAKFVLNTKRFNDDFGI